MREYEVDWKTFEECLPEKGARIVVEVERKRAGMENPLKIYSHTSECVTGTFGGTFYTHNARGSRKWVDLTKKHGQPLMFSLTSRWYLYGSERLKAKGVQ